MKHLKLFEQFGSGLEIRPSNIPNSGNGLFATKFFEDESIIDEFTGEIITAEESMADHFNDKSDRGRYLISLSNGKVLDVYHSKCFARVANDAEGFQKSEWENNSELMEDDYGRMYLVATRDIYPGEEVFTAYGEDYWNHFRN